MKKLLSIVTLTVTITATFICLGAFAGTNTATPQTTGPASQNPATNPNMLHGKHLHKSCMQIVKACKTAGFVQGDWKQGNGLWRDCVDPIVQGKTPQGATKTLPTVDANTVSTCKANYPKFGEGKVGSNPNN